MHWIAIDINGMYSQKCPKFGVSTCVYEKREVTFSKKSVITRLKYIRYSLYNLISIDAHGHGETTGRGEDFTFWDTASDSLQLLSKLGLDEFYVLETTQGGFTAFRMALPEPYRVKGLILLGTTVFSTTEQLKLNLLKSRDTWCETKVPSDEAMLAGAASFGGPARVGEKVYEKIKQMWIKRYAEPEGYDPAFNCLLNRDGIDDKINVPTLVLHGAEDPVIPAE
ncbi:unnamed protein product [Rotaria sordida]|uniref:AB hydrolase-1 domain-containing protein n=1 Tax=Rotaria sordida TaxID=392033 RepID=A0A814FMY8_9BILA|nr:unnamed protein product [Rotaria sordida]